MLLLLIVALVLIKIFSVLASAGFSQSSLPENLQNFQMRDAASTSFDCNNDGLLDIFFSGFTQNPSPGFFKVAFSSVTGSVYSSNLPDMSLGAFAPGDLDLDGDVDLLICGQQNPTGMDFFSFCYIMLSGGNCEFTTLPLFLNGSDYSKAAILADFNADGLPDVFTAGSITNSSASIYDKPRINFAWNLGRGNFEPADPSQVFPGIRDVMGGAVVATDLNRDGFTDLLVTGVDASYTNASSCLFLSYSNATFKACSFLYPKRFYFSSLVQARFPFEHDPLICDSGVTTDGYFVDFSLLKISVPQNSYSTFTNRLSPVPALGIAKGSISIADYSGDGFPDIFMVGDTVDNISIPDPVALLYTSSGPGALVNGSAANLTGISKFPTSIFVDYDGDNLLDLLVGGGNRPLNYLRNNGQPPQTSVPEIGSVAVTIIAFNATHSLSTVTWPNQSCCHSVDVRLTRRSTGDLLNSATVGPNGKRLINGPGNVGWAEKYSLILPSNVAVDLCASVRAIGADYRVGNSSAYCVQATSTSDGGNGGGDSNLLAAIIGGAAGGGGLVLVLLICCVLCCLACCCLLCIFIVVLVAMAAVVAVAAVVGVAGVGGGAAAGAVGVVLRRRYSGQESVSAEGDPMDSVLDGNVQRLTAAGLRVIPYEALVFGRKVGGGAFGKVYVCEWKGVECAAKVLEASDDAIAEIEREIAVLQKLGNHPNVIQFLGIAHKPDAICIVTKFCKHGSVHDMINKEPQLMTPAVVSKIALGAALGIKFLHENGVVHRDIAARNFLVDDSLVVQVADFGLSRILDEENSASGATTASSIGPVRWMAPESMSKREYSSASDAYMFGMFLYELWVRKVPFHQDTDLLRVAEMVRGGRRPTDLDAMPPTVADLCRRLWAASRPDMTAVVRCLRDVHAEYCPDRAAGEAPVQESEEYAAAYYAASEISSGPNGQ
jgi:hypothetical protein